MSAGTVVIVGLPDGTVGAFPLADVVQARRLAAELGLGASPRANAAPAVAPVAGQERLLNSRELSELLGVGDTLLEQMAKDGRIPYLRIGKALRFKFSDVEAALRHADRSTATHMQAPDLHGRFGEHNRKTTGQNPRLSSPAPQPEGGH